MKQNSMCNMRKNYSRALHVPRRLHSAPKTRQKLGFGRGKSAVAKRGLRSRGAQPHGGRGEARAGLDGFERERCGAHENSIETEPASGAPRPALRVAPLFPANFWNLNVHWWVFFHDEIISVSARCILVEISNEYGWIQIFLTYRMYDDILMYTAWSEGLRNNSVSNTNCKL